ncbi:uncharacterized protein (DUF302 family) [Bacillus sp. SORGH_AS 510]|uniref:DUF302 domain-containing protein n=1 Tax=Bacillus sp. SORGH_AS_0510 TaxID=3041771 RepID=UPI002783ADAE|nr:DUF302 domain-containing protein [Bacillus sp. SORGH_AS_0510]MDQ1145806.1 uncharacterized protein (DUF302 family) [Bacillus sp. SORGH_AS_0510]
MFHYTVDSNKSLTEAVNAVEEALKEEKFGVLWSFNIQEKLKEKGVDLEKEFIVLEVCNPHEAKRVLMENNLVGYFLPCKIVVYKEENQTKIGMPKPSALMSMVSDENLGQIALDIEMRLISCLEKEK